MGLLLPCNVVLYQVDLLLHEGNYSWSEGKSVDAFDSTVVQVETDAGFGVTPRRDVLGDPAWFCD